MLPVPKAGQVRITMASQVALVVKKVKVKGAQSCLTLCDPVDCTVQFSPVAQSCLTLCDPVDCTVQFSPVAQSCLTLCDPVDSTVQFSPVAQSCLTLLLHDSQHARPPCPSQGPGVYSNSCPSSR